MIGAIIGDIVGSRWEFSPTNDYDFELFSEKNGFTDDTICTVAVADALLHGSDDYGKYIHEWCRKYPHPMGGYGGRFAKWVMSDDPRPYGSYGNGAAMRVSPVAWAKKDLEFKNLSEQAERTAACSHNHPEGIKGAQSVVIAIHDCHEMHCLFERIGHEEIMNHGLKRAIHHFGYSIDIKPEDVQNRFDETCQGTVPVAFWIIGQSQSFEDAIRKAVSLGADADTLGAIVGSIAEAIWEIPEWMKKKALSYLPEEMESVVLGFHTRYMKDSNP
jgi:ADP-ribosylglycohydrolase